MQEARDAAAVLATAGGLVCVVQFEGSADATAPPPPQQQGPGLTATCRAACGFARRPDVAPLILLWTLAASARALETLAAEGQVVVVRGAACAALRGELAVLWGSE